MPPLSMTAFELSGFQMPPLSTAAIDTTNKTKKIASSLSQLCITWTTKRLTGKAKTSTVFFSFRELSN